jgi:hypothetical protein
MAFLRNFAAPIGRKSKGSIPIFVLNGGMKSMRFAARALVAGILIVCCRGAVAAEASSSWWPFGQHADAPGAQSPTAGQATLPPATAALPPTVTPPVGAGPVAHEAQMPTTASDDSHWMLNTPKKKVSWPTLHMPKALSSKSAPEANKNKWVDKAPVKPKTSPMQSVKKGANSVAAGTKSAWHKTVAAVTPGSSTKTAAKPAPAPHVASRETSPPLWKKMFGAKEPTMQQPQTVPQWMAQKRLDP